MREEGEGCCTLDRRALAGSSRGLLPHTRLVRTPGPSRPRPHAWGELHNSHNKAAASRSGWGGGARLQVQCVEMPTGEKPDDCRGLAGVLGLVHVDPSSSTRGSPSSPESDHAFSESVYACSCAFEETAHICSYVLSKLTAFTHAL